MDTLILILLYMATRILSCESIHCDRINLYATTITSTLTWPKFSMSHTQIHEHCANVNLYNCNLYQLMQAKPVGNIK